MLTLLLALAADLPRTLGESPADQGDEGAYSFGFRVGAVHLPDPDATTWTASVAFRGGMGSPFVFEASGMYYGADFDDEDDDARVVPVQASVLWMPWPKNEVRPFVLAGAGLLFVDVDNGDSEFLFGFHVGAGVDADLGRGAFFSGDLRWNFYGEPDDLEEDLDFLQATVGIHFRFG